MYSDYYYIEETIKPSVKYKTKDYIFEHKIMIAPIHNTILECVDMIQDDITKYDTRKSVENFFVILKRTESDPLTITRNNEKFLQIFE